MSEILEHPEKYVHYNHFEIGVIWKFNQTDSKPDKDIATRSSCLRMSKTCLTPVAPWNIQHTGPLRSHKTTVWIKCNFLYDPIHYKPIHKEPVSLQRLLWLPGPELWVHQYHGGPLRPGTPHSGRPRHGLLALIRRSDITIYITFVVIVVQKTLSCNQEYPTSFCCQSFIKKSFFCYTVAGTVSSCLPPWLDTHTPATPHSAARAASAAVIPVHNTKYWSCLSHQYLSLCVYLYITLVIMNVAIVHNCNCYNFFGFGQNTYWDNQCTHGPLFLSKWLEDWWFSWATEHHPMSVCHQFQMW